MAGQCPRSRDSGDRSHAQAPYELIRVLRRAKKLVDMVISNPETARLGEETSPSVLYENGGVLLALEVVESLGEGPAAPAVDLSVVHNTLTVRVNARSLRRNPDKVGWETLVSCGCCFHDWMRFQDSVR